MARGDPLFSKYGCFDELMARDRAAKEAVEIYAADDLLNSSPDDLANLLEHKFHIAVPVLKEDAIEVDQQEAQVDVSRDWNRMIFDRGQPFYIKGTDVTFFVPFEGDAEVFELRPSVRTLNPPRGVVEDREVVLSYTRLDQDSAAVKREFEQDLAAIRQSLARLAEDVANFNGSLRGKLVQWISARREKLLKDRGMVASLGYPLRRRESVPAVYAPPPVRKKVAPAMPGGAVAAPPGASEPFLEMEVYEHILSLLSQMAVVIERSPQAFRTMGEEDIRFVLLVPLNTHYEGRASAEAFNFEGKTDILIRDSGKNIFVAECKFWDGPESLRKAIDQILGYTCWRDTKTALLIFNRHRQLSTVISKIPEIVKQHPNFRREEKYNSETGFRFVLRHRDDVARELILTILVFEVPA